MHILSSFVLHDIVEIRSLRTNISIFNVRRSVSSLSSIQTNLSSESSPAQRRETKHSQTMTIVEASPKSSKVSLSSRLSKDSRTSTREKFDSIGSASSPWNSILSNTGKKKSSSSSSIASSMIGFGRKHGISMGRRKSSIETPRNFKCVFEFNNLNIKIDAIQN